MKDLLVICYPTWGLGEGLHLNSAGNRIVLAPDYFLKCVAELGVSLDLVSLTSEKAVLPTFQSVTVPLHYSEVDTSQYRVFWHMFRDPTQPEVLRILDEIGFDPGKRPVLNRAKSLSNLFKDIYLPVLARYGLASRVFANISPGEIDWVRQEHSIRVSSDGRYICPYSYNNNRGDYQERAGREAVSEYVDNLDEAGYRSIFRVGYALGKCVMGYRYYGQGLIIKTGSACRHESYKIPEVFHAAVAEAMTEIGVDVCHLEGIEKDGRIYLFDVNPYPTANGSTLSTITRATARIIAESLR